jgi:hypothetical protein
MRIRRRRRVDIAVLAGVVLLAGVAALAGVVAAATPGAGGPAVGRGRGRPGRSGLGHRGDRLRLRRPPAPRHLPRRPRPRPRPTRSGPLGQRPRPGPGHRHAHQTRLRIGDPDRTVTGRHRYSIGYRLAGVAPGGRLAWDAVGTSWTVPIGRAELHVAAPWRLEEVVCVRGVAGSTAPCQATQPEPGHLVATAEDLDPGHGVTLYATAGPAWPPPRPCPPRPPASPGTRAPGRCRRPWRPAGCWPGRARPRPSAPGSCGSGPRPGRRCGCAPSRPGGSWPPPRPTTPRRRPSAATCASTAPGRWPWASWTAGRGRWRPPRCRPPTRPWPATRCSARLCCTTPRGR